MLLGCIGDDFTGSSDLANTLAKQGMRTVQYTGIPQTNSDKDVEAGVVALKSRSNDTTEAVTQSLAALKWLQAQGCEQFFFKYCSTFDSTLKGNIGPVAQALAEALNAYKVVVCPAFPGTGRSIYQGHLFVNDALLNESGMQNHPLTPMTDADIRRWLKPQTTLNVGHIAATDVLAGSSSIEHALEREHAANNRLIVVDALRDEDLMHIGKALSSSVLITGGSGIAMGLPRNFADQGRLAGTANSWRGETGQCVALSGSCSATTRAQVELHAQSNPSLQVNAAQIIDASVKPADVIQWLQGKTGVPLIYSSADPSVVKQVQSKFGTKESAQALEQFFAEVAQLLTTTGVRKILTAGGETSGAIVEGLSLKSLEIGPEIDPGVPALRAGPELVIALKSGNFGASDYFAKAEAILSQPA